MSQKNEIKNYTILSNDEIAIIYKNAYQKFKEQALEFFNKYSESYPPVLKKDFILEQMTKALVLCYKYNISTIEHLAQILLSETKEDVDEIITHIKKEALKVRTKLQPLEQAGLLRRNLYGVTFPPIFQDDNRIYIHTNPILSETELMQDIVDYLNFPLPKEERFFIKAETEETKKVIQKNKAPVKRFWLVQNQPMKPVSKLLNWEKDCLLLLNILKNDEKLRADFYRFITKIPNDKKLGLYFSRFKKKKDFPPCHLDTIFLRHLISYHPKNQDILLFALESIAHKLKKFRTDLHSIRIKTSSASVDEESIDLIMLSTRANDISTMSSFTNWESCMSVGGSYFQDIMMQIGSGSIIAYGVNSQNPQKKLARAILKPYESAKTLKEREEYFNIQKKEQPVPKFTLNKIFSPDYQELTEKKEAFIQEHTAHLDEYDFFLDPKQVERIYKIDKVYGLQNPSFVKILEEFVLEHLNTPKAQGTFMIASPMYLDQLDPTYQIYDKKDKDNLITYLTHNGISYQFESNNIVKVDNIDITGIQNLYLRPLEANTISLDGYMLNTSCQQIKVNNLSVFEPETFQLKNFPQGISVEDTLTFKESHKDFDMPLGIKAKEVNASHTHLSSIAPDLRTNILNIMHTNITSVPDISLQVLNVHGCQGLKSLPQNIKIKTKLNISFSGISSLPALNTHTIIANGASHLKRLDKNIQFSHFQAPNSGLETMPQNLKAASFIASATFITKIPKGTSIDEVDLRHTPLVEIATPIKIKQLNIEGTPIGTLPNGLSFEELNASVCTNLKSLPNDIKISKKLTVAGSAIQSLPPLETETVYLINCKNIHSLPAECKISKLLAQGSGITFLPPNFKVGVIFLETSQIEYLPQGFEASMCNVSKTPLKKIQENVCVDTLICSNTQLSEVPASLKTNIFEAVDCPCLTNLPAGFTATKKINLTKCPIQKLDNITTENLIISHCEKIKKLGRSVQFKNLDASNSSLEKLPDNLAVQNINLIKCPIKELPNNLKAQYIDAPKSQISEIPNSLEADYLNLDSTHVVSVPIHLNVKTLSLRDTPISVIHYSEHFKNIILNAPVRYIHPNIPNSAISGISNDEINSAKSRYKKAYKNVKFQSDIISKKQMGNEKN